MSDYQLELDDLLETAAKEGASDLYLTVGRFPTLRIDGRLAPLAGKKLLLPEDVSGLISILLPKEKKEQFLKQKDILFSYAFYDKARFRVNLYQQKGFPAAVLRLILLKIKELTELNLPSSIADFINFTKGLLIITGPLGGGKTTTIASLIEKVNNEKSEHVLTLENPIEYIFSSNKSVIEQREYGLDFLMFSDAVVLAAKKDINILAISNLNDEETILQMLKLASSSFVIASLDAYGSSEALNYITDSVSQSNQNLVRNLLAVNLIGVISQRLIPRVSGGRIPALEVLISNVAVRNLIKENKIHQLDLIISTSREKGMMPLNRHLSELVRKKEISMESAKAYSADAEELKKLVR